MTTVDWSVFAGEDGGHRFERFCTDLLRAQGYFVEHMAKGGNDEGKDILILQHEKNAAAPTEIACLVECKSRASKQRKAISLEDINRSLWALFESKCTCLVLFSTYKFNSQAVNCFLRVNERGRLRIAWNDQDDLIEMGRRYPDVWRVHFRTEPPPAPESCLSVSGIRAFGEQKQIFWKDGEPLQILVHNCGPYEGRAKLRKGSVVLDEVELHHHGKKILRVPSTEEDAANPYRGLTITFEPKGEKAPEDECPVDYDPNIESRRRVDHIFADPGNLLGPIVEALSRGKSVHVRGRAGCGKTRLIAETQRRIAQALFTDSSRSDEPDGLFNSMVQHVTGWPAHLIGQMAAGLIPGLVKSTGCNPGQLAIVADFCAERNGHTHSAVAQALVQLTSRTAKHLVVDNIQDASELDEAILIEALSPSSPVTCLLATRTDGPDLPATAGRILRKNIHGSLVDIDAEKDADRRLHAFIRAASLDEPTRTLLTNLVDDALFQTFVSKLKALRQLGALEVLDDGRFRLLEQTDGSDFTSYAQLQELILYSRLPDELRKVCTATIQAAAIFGDAFPVSFIENLFGEAGIEALNELERRELIISMSDPSPYGISFHFDHPLTRDAVLGSLVTITRTRLHEAAARFITTWPEFQPGSGHYDFAFHYAAAGRAMEALSGYEAGAKHYMSTGRVGGAQAGLLRALPLFDRLPFERERDSVERELDLRELLLETALLVNLPEDEWERQIDAFQIQSHLFPGIAGVTRRLGRGHCFLACLDGYRRHIPAAWRELEKAIEVLSGLGDPLPLAEAMKWGANLLKNMGRYDHATAMATEAYEVYSRNGDARRAGETATELSHVHYEAYRFSDAMEWGNRALSHYVAVGHPSLVSRARIDIARMQAVLHPTEGKTAAELELSVRLARHAGIGAHIGKALMNWGIYLAIETEDRGSAASKFTAAAEVLQLHPNRYISMLLRFAEAVLLLPQRSQADLLKRGIPGNELITWCQHFDSPDQIGDRRMQMMIKALSAVNNDAVVTWLKRSHSNAFTRHVGVGLGNRFARLERENPFFRRGRFALYY